MNLLMLLLTIASVNIYASHCVWNGHQNKRLPNEQSPH